MTAGLPTGSGILLCMRCVFIFAVYIIDEISSIVFYHNNGKIYWQQCSLLLLYQLTKFLLYSRWNRLQCKFFPKNILVPLKNRNQIRINFFKGLFCIFTTFSRDFFDSSKLTRKIPVEFHLNFSSLIP